PARRRRRRRTPRAACRTRRAACRPLLPCRTCSTTPPYVRTVYHSDERGARSAERGMTRMVGEATCLLQSSLFRVRIANRVLVLGAADLAARAQQFEVRDRLAERERVLERRQLGPPQSPAGPGEAAAEVVCACRGVAERGEDLAQPD